ncbi:MAG: Rne/Rng family ribonuclease [bacterium]
MEGKKILISIDGDESRIALVNNEKLENLHIELIKKGRIVGNIYKGIVANIQPAFQAAFIDYGAERKGFLSINDINLQLYKSTSLRSSHGKPPIQSVLKHGQAIMVQVLKEQIGHKGAALTTNISLPGRFLVFMPNSDKGGISKKIENEDQRNRLKDLLKGLENEDAAIIVRTAGIDRSLVELKKDYRTLLSRWRKIQQQFNRMQHPGMIYEEQNMVVRTLRDYFTTDINEVLINDANAFQKALELFKDVIPRQQKKLRLFVGDEPLFSAYGIEEQIEQLSVNKVQLKSGGSIVIDTTEALVAIDVNSGASKQESKIEETALRTNLEAASEIARQLRLRNLGGLIVIDFIDMNLQKNRKKVMQRLEEAVSSDKAKCIIDTISQFGLLEMSRQRIGSELSYKVESVCPTCGGKGSIPSVITSANIILRKIRELAAKGNLTQVQAKLPLELANYLLNEKRDCLRDLELEFDILIQLTADISVPPGQIPKLDVKLIIPPGDEKELEMKEPIVFKKDNHKNHHKKKENEKRTKESTSQKKQTYDNIIHKIAENDTAKIKNDDNKDSAERSLLMPSSHVLSDKNEKEIKDENEIEAKSEHIGTNESIKEYNTIEHNEISDKNNFKNSNDTKEELEQHTEAVEEEGIDRKEREAQKYHSGRLATPFVKVRPASWLRARFGSRRAKEVKKGLHEEDETEPIAEVISLEDQSVKQKNFIPDDKILQPEENVSSLDEKVDCQEEEKNIVEHHNEITG